MKLTAAKRRIYDNEPEHEFYYTQEQLSPLKNKVDAFMSFVEKNTTFFEETKDDIRSVEAEDFITHFSFNLFIDDHYRLLSDNYPGRLASNMLAG